MAIITVSRGTFSGGQSLAECIAEKIGYRCLSREKLVESAARRYGVTEEKLTRALSEKPGILERLTIERIHYLAFIRATLCKEVRDDNLVYHGHAGHLLLRGVPNVLKVRVIANMEFRIRHAMDRHHLSREEAIRYISKVDDERAKWTRFLYHVDWNDPALYDLVVNFDQIGFSSICELVYRTVSLDEFKTTPEWQKIRDDLELGAEVRALIASDKNVGSSDQGVEIEANGGVITIKGSVESLEDADKIREIVRKIPGVKDINSTMEIRVGRWPKLGT